MLVTIEFVLQIVYLMLTLLIVWLESNCKKCQKIHGAEIAYLKLIFTCIELSWLPVISSQSDFVTVISSQMIT